MTLAYKLSLDLCLGHGLCFPVRHPPTVAWNIGLRVRPCAPQIFIRRSLPPPDNSYTIGLLRQVANPPCQHLRLRLRGTPCSPSRRWRRRDRADFARHSPRGDRSPAGHRGMPGHGRGACAMMPTARLAEQTHRCENRTNINAVCADPAPSPAPPLRRRRNAGRFGETKPTAAHGKDGASPPHRWPRFCRNELILFWQTKSAPCGQPVSRKRPARARRAYPPLPTLRALPHLQAGASFISSWDMIPDTTKSP